MPSLSRLSQHRNYSSLIRTLQANQSRLGHPEGRNHCAQCAIGGATERLVVAARPGRVAAHSADARERRGHPTAPRQSAIWLDTIESASLADYRTVYTNHSANAPANVNLGHCIPNWRLPLICWPHSARLRSAPDALAGASGTGWHLQRTTNLKNWIMSVMAMFHQLRKG